MTGDDDLCWGVLDTHLREAAFCFELREAVLDVPHYTLTELEAGPERRLIAHLDGLILGGQRVAERLLLPAIEDEDEEVEQIAAATLAVLAQPESLWRPRVVEILDHAEEPSQRGGVTRGLQLGFNADLGKWIGADVRTTQSSNAGLAARLEVLAAGCTAPDSVLEAAFVRADDLSVALAAAYLARFTNNPSIIAHLAPLAQAGDPSLRRVTIESALCWSMSGAWPSALHWAFCPGPSPFRRTAMTWVALLGDSRVHQQLFAALANPGQRRDALWAAGLSGRAAAVDHCMEWLSDEELGPLAAEAIAAITGLPTNDPQFWREVSDADDGLPALELDDLDADLVPDSEANLPVPNPSTISAWWEAHRGHFESGLRYVGGHVMTGDVLLAGLWHAPMRRRHAMALELALRTRARSIVDTRALCAVQRSQLQALSGQLGSLDCQRGLPR
jgi:uncharacterized protein (TIGR02270 family)